MTYTLTNTTIIIRDADQAHIPADPANSDYQTYQYWLLCGNTPNPYVLPPPPPPTTVQVNSTGTLSIDGVYAFDAHARSNLMAASLYIQVNNKFPAGQTSFPWYDSTGTPHLFTSTALFQQFASAIADYAAAWDIGMTPASPITIP